MSPRRHAPFALAALVISCGNNNTPTPTDAAPPSSALTSAGPVLPEAPPSPFFVVLESASPISFSGLTGGVWIADADRKRQARATGTADLTAAPMPDGLPSERGRILRVAGRLPGAMWLSFEKLKDDGKVESNPLYWLTKDGFKLIADDWKPHIAAWSKNRILAASTSSLRLKLKVIAPSLPSPPDDLPNATLADQSCDKTLTVHALSALSTGEVLVAGNCKPDTAAGAGASSMRYVVIRWGYAQPPSVAPTASASVASSQPDSGAPALLPDTTALQAKLGIVEPMPGVSRDLRHRALYARTASDVYAAAAEDDGKGGSISHLWHFDGTTWGVEPLPRAPLTIRAVSGTSDGTIWLVTDHDIWKKPPGAAWSEVPPPTRAFPEQTPSWELLDLVTSGPDDVWIAARHTSASSKRDVVLRLKEPKQIVRW